MPLRRLCAPLTLSTLLVRLLLQLHINQGLHLRKETWLFRSRWQGYARERQAEPRKEKVHIETCAYLMSVHWYWSLVLLPSLPPAGNGMPASACRSVLPPLLVAAHLPAVLEHATAATAAQSAGGPAPRRRQPGRWLPRRGLDCRWRRSCVAWCCLAGCFCIFHICCQPSVRMFAKVLPVDVFTASILWQAICTSNGGKAFSNVNLKTLPKGEGGLQVFA